MTAREKLKLEHPDWTEEKFDFIFENHCPDIYGYSKSDISWCQDNRCKECWDQEIPETEENIEKENEIMEKKTKTQLIEEIVDLKKELDKLEKYKKYEDAADELAAFRDSLIGANFSRDEAMMLIFKMIEAAASKL